ncbi:hypothetical protein BJP62_03990 [Jeongeupia sp. USM3]|nr:hypothetical protein BJP62_03990 [Jeongeupia sp. USM3]
MLTNLEFLDLDSTRFHGVEAIEGLSLRYLHLASYSGALNLNFVAGMRTLEEFATADLRGGVESITCLERLENLKILMLFHSKVLDLDLSVIKRLPLIQYVSLDMKRGYNVSLKELEALGLCDEWRLDAVRSNIVRPSDAFE